MSYPQGQARRAFVDESAHSVESGRVGGWRRMERQPNRRGAGHQHRDGRADATATRRGRLRSRPDPQVQSQFPPRRIFDGAAEAKLIALACGPAPAGRARWTLRLLEEKVVELQIVESASDNTIGRTLKKTFSSPISSSNG